MNPPICNQNNSVWASERKADIKHHRLLVKRKTFLIAPRVVVSAGVCVGGKGRLHLKNCWWKIVSSCYRMVSFSSKTALRLTRHASHSHRTGCSQTAVTSSTRMSAPPQFTRSKYIGLSRLGAVLESYHKLRPKPKIQFRAERVCKFRDELN